MEANNKISTNPLPSSLPRALLKSHSRALLRSLAALSAAPHPDASREKALEELSQALASLAGTDKSAKTLAADLARALVTRCSETIVTVTAAKALLQQLEGAREPTRTLRTLRAVRMVAVGSPRIFREEGLWEGLAGAAVRIAEKQRVRGRKNTMYFTSLCILLPMPI